jgi:hypothetical protein
VRKLAARYFLAPLKSSELKSFRREKRLKNSLGKISKLKKRRSKLLRDWKLSRQRLNVRHSERIVIKKRSKKRLKKNRGQRIK